MTQKTYWYQEFWAIVVFGLPLIVVIASLFCVYLAFHFRDPEIKLDSTPLALVKTPAHNTKQARHRQ